MRPISYLLMLILLMSACATTNKSNSLKYTVVKDPESKILSGTINRSIIENDTAFKWFKENGQYGTAEPSAVEAFKKNAPKFSLVVVIGTWCHDSQNLLPKFYRLIEKSGFPEAKITLISVDRDKKSFDKSSQKYKITNVPTFIVFKDGKELARVIEYGKTGDIEKELGEIVANL